MDAVMATVALGAKETVFALVMIALVFAAGVAFGRGWSDSRRARRMGKRRYGESVGTSVTFGEALARRGIGVSHPIHLRETFEEAVERRSAENAAKKPEPPKEEPWSWL